VPLLAYALTQSMGWRGALKALGVLMIVVALPGALIVREPRASPLQARRPRAIGGRHPPPPDLLPPGRGEHGSIGAVGGTMQNLKLYLSLDRKLPQGRSRACCR